MRIVVTGSAGFIGFHLCNKLLESGHDVFGLDCLSDYYDVNLKRDRHFQLTKHARFVEIIVDLTDVKKTFEIFQVHKPQIVIHLAAQAGVRYSIDHPDSYISSNLVGTYSVLEAVRNSDVQHFLFASTSSVYGSNRTLPYSELQKTDHQLSFYAGTKKTGEILSHSYSHLYDIPTTCFRFFTVYGPWGRPDMALFKFTKAILEGDTIEVYNNGEMYRDFTYVGDIVNAIDLLIQRQPELNLPVSNIDSLSEVAPWRVVNIGNSTSEKLMDFIEILEDTLGFKAEKLLKPLQPGDVESTWADCSLLEELTGYKPNTSIKKGISEFVSWYRNYYQI